MFAGRKGDEMNRTPTFTVTAIAGLSLLIACGGETGEDAGTDAGEMIDTGPPGVDAGFDAARPDAGPTGCTGTGCEFVELSAGIVHICGRRANGEVMCWGRNQEFQLGDGRVRHQSCTGTGMPADCSGTPVNARFDDGAGQPIIEDAEALTGVGFTATCALRSGELWCWSEQTVPDVAGGVSRVRRVGERDFEEISGILQGSVSHGHACVISGSERNLDCVGSNSFGQLGNGEIDAQTVDFSRVLLDPMAAPPTELTGVTEVLVSHGAFTCARTPDDVYCWGLDTSGQIGDPGRTSLPCLGSMLEMLDCARSPRVVGGTAAPIGATIDVAVGSSHACAITGTGTSGPVVCWGDNRTGQLAQPDAVASSSVPTAVAGLADATMVAAGSRNSYALHVDGTISSWGFNLLGQLGDGTVDHGASCTTGTDIGDCSRTPVTVSGITDATFIAASASYACAILADGSVTCWGSNTNRQLGDGTRDTRNTPVPVIDTAP